MRATGEFLKICQEVGLIMKLTGSFLSRFLLDYQKGQGLPEAIKGHIQAGIDEANKDSGSLLVFSGGETRAITGPLTEGASYFHVADAMQLWPPGSTVRARTVTEEFATDSFENL